VAHITKSFSIRPIIPASLFTLQTLSLLFFVILLTGCSEDKRITQTPPATEVTTITIQPRDTPITSEFVAKTASSRRVEIRSRVEGFLEKKVYTEGSMVKKDQVLFIMDKKPFEAQLNAANAELAQQLAIRQTADANLKRIRPLAKKNAVAQKELDDALGSYRTAKATVEQARAKVVQAELNLGYCTIKSPLNGISSFAVKREGAYIGIGSESLLTYVAQIQPMWVEFSISENQTLKYYESVRNGTLITPEKDNYIVEIVLADGTIYNHTGRITFADASLSETTGTFLLRAEIPNPDRLLRPGQFVRALLKGAVRPNAILIPQIAVQQGAKGSFVWVIDENSKAAFRPVTPGSWLGNKWFIDEGLKEGDQVVVEGAIKLRAGAIVKIVKPGDDTTNKIKSTARAE